MSTFQDERQIVGEILATQWTLSPVAYPGTVFDPPVPSHDPANPAAWVGFDVTYSGSELISFSGAAKIEGMVMLTILQEKDTGDDLIRAYMEELRTLFKSADTSEMWFFEPMPLSVEDMEGWEGRALAIPFLRVRE